MSATPRPRPPHTMTQVMRPSCEVIGLPEIHSYIGPGINNFGAPCIMKSLAAYWWSDGTAWDKDSSTSKKSKKVFAANDPLLMQGAKAKGRRHHLVFAHGVSLLPAAPVADWVGLGLPLEWVSLVDQNKGESITIFAPRHVKADVEGKHEVATIRFFAGTSMGLGDLSVCCDPADHLGTYASQTPNTVFLGMSTADTMGSLIAWFITNLANTIIKVIVGEIASHLSSRFEHYVTRALANAASLLMAQALRALRWAGGPAITHALPFATDHGLEAAFNMADGRFDHTSIDDGIADLWDEYAVLP